MGVDARTVKVLAIVLIVAGLARAAILHWSPYPATLDGFFHVRSAELIASTGYVPTPIDWDRTVMAAFAGVVTQVLGVKPLTSLQPLSAIVGVGPVLVAMALVRRVGRDGLRLSESRLRAGMLVAGGVLALDGLFVRRSGVPDEEMLGLLFVPLIAYAFGIWLLHREQRWGLVAAGLLVLLPSTHSLSTTVAVLTVGVMAAVFVSRDWERVDITRALFGVAVAVGAALATYWLARSMPELTLSYTERLFAEPRLLGAWVLLLVVGTVWFVRTTPRIQRTVVGVNLLAGFGLLLANLTVPVFIGTIPTPSAVLWLVAPLVVLAVTAAWGIDIASDRFGRGAAVLGLFLAPVALGDYFLTAGLTPDLFEAVLRVQTYVHLPMAMVAGLVVARRFDWFGGLVSTKDRRGQVVVVVLLVSAALTAPVGVMALDTATVPGTTMPEQFAGTDFVVEHVDGEWASDDQVVHMAGLYFDESGHVEPVRRWVGGGAEPDVPVLASDRWVTRGVHLYPRPAMRVEESRYDAWRAGNQVVYSGSGAGTDAYVVVVPVE